LQARTRSHIGCGTVPRTKRPELPGNQMTQEKFGEGTRRIDRLLGMK
jgi:hypothetical protein